MKIKSITTTEYAFRKLYLVKIKNSKGVVMYVCFYRSAGLNNPEKKADDIFPILGICDEGHLGKDIRKAFGSSYPSGWICKNCQSDCKGKHRDDMRSYYNIPGLRTIAHLLEDMERNGQMSAMAKVVPCELFLQIIDSLYCDANVGSRFFSAACLKKEVRA